MKYINFILIILLFACNNANEIKDNNDEILLIGTFNIEWLGDGINDRKQRNDNDYQNIAYVIENTNAEILALQEIENENALKLLVKYLDGWNYIIRDNGSEQNLAFIYKNYLSLEDIGLYNDLEVKENATREGLIARVSSGNLDIYLLNVHLKSTSRYDDTPEKREESFYIRRQQSNEIVEFKDSLLNLNNTANVIILGDFNDNPIRGDKSNIIILDTNFYIPTKNLESCKSEYYDLIDHIMLSENLIDNYENSSAFVFDVKSIYNEDTFENISDHCPVILRLNNDK